MSQYEIDLKHQRDVARRRESEIQEVLDTVKKERDEARDWVRRLTAEQRTLTCVYCGHAYPPGSPTHGAEVLTAHIGTCQQHPMHYLLINYRYAVALMDDEEDECEAGGEACVSAGLAWAQMCRPCRLWSLREDLSTRGPIPGPRE